MFVPGKARSFLCIDYFLYKGVNDAVQKNIAV